MAYSYDRRTAGVSKSIDALKPLVADAEAAASAFKTGIAEIEKAMSLVKKVRAGAQAAIPRGYLGREHRLYGIRDGDAAHAVYDYAKHLAEDVEEIQPSKLRGIEKFFDEFVSEMKAHIHQDEATLEEAAKKRPQAT